MQSSSTYEEALDRATTLWGIEPQYWDIWGLQHTTSSDTKKAILQALGVNTQSKEDLDRAIEQRFFGEWSRLLPHCLVAGESQSKQVVASFPVELADARVRIDVGLENDIPRVWDVDLHSLPVLESAEFQERQFVRKTIPLPQDAPLGYHEVAITVATLHARMPWIVAPDHAYLPENLRAGGLAIALYAIRSRRNWGCGDFRDLEDTVDWLADEVGASFIALNPLHAIHNRRPFNTSPYLPNSVFYKNIIYLDVERIQEFCTSRRVQRLWTSPAVQQEVEALRRSDFVEYERVQALKMHFLKLVFAEFLREFRDSSPRASEFRAFIEREGEPLERFATYCALDEWIHKRQPDAWVWTDWPEAFREPDSSETKRFRDKHWRLVQFYKFLQWQIDVQLAAAQKHGRDRGLRIGLYHDLALATDSYGSDLWAYRSFYAAGCRVGSPPDDFSPQGQDWAFPPPNSAAHRESGYRLFIESIRKNCRHGGALRIDHVMRFFRLYWIPEGVDATRGAYVRDYHEDLIRIVALESFRQRVVVIGEDLGTVETHVRESLERFGILSYRLLYFEKNASGEFRRHEEYPIQALVSSTTHDLPTLAGFWINEDIEARRRAGILSDDASYRSWLNARAVEKQRMLDALFAGGFLPGWFPRNASAVPELTGELHNAVIGFLASTPSRLLVINQEDLAKQTSQQNLPGTTWQYPNWSRKMQFSLDELRSGKQATDFVSMFRDWLRKTGRTN